jgi:hypothetical protein
MTVDNLCNFCNHGNAADAKCCSQCGSSLCMLPCPHCGTANDAKAASCSQCAEALPAHGTNATDPLSSVIAVALRETRTATPPNADDTEPFPRRHARRIAGTALFAIIAAIAVLGYNSYRQRSFTDVQLPSAAGGKPRGADSSAGNDKQAHCTTAGAALSLCKPTPTVTHTQPRQ